MNKLILLICSGIYTVSFAQKEIFLNYPKVTEKEIKKEKSTIDPSAGAEILYRSVHYFIDPSTHQLNQEVYSQIKVYDKNRAKDYLTVELNLYQSTQSSNAETLSNLKATTYNYNNGKIETDKVEKDSKYKSKESKNYIVSKFTFPNVKDGSVLEYKYKRQSPFFWIVPTTIIEKDIPVVYTEYIFDMPKYFGYNINYTGALTPNKRHVAEEFLYGIEGRTYRFGFDNLKPFEEEEYVLNSDNYKTKVSAELNSVAYTNGEVKNYALSWEDIRKQLNENDDFGKELKKKLPSNFIPADISSEKDPLERVKKILAFAQKSFKWDRVNGVFTDNGTNNLIKTKTGNVADINLTLIKMLRECKITAYPLVLSTINNGIIGYHPSINSLNYVVACIEIDGKLHVLDASNKQSLIDILPPKVYNYKGFLMTDKEVKELVMENTNISKTFLTVNATLNPDGTFKGSFSDKDTSLYSMLNNESFEDDKEAYQKLYKDRYKFALTDIKTELLPDNDFETTFNFTADNLVDAVGNKFIINPLLFLNVEKNNFDQKGERKMPVELIAGYEKTKNVSITIPDGYVVENLPKSKKIITEDKEISYTYDITKENNKINIKATTYVASSNYPKEYYVAFKQIWDAMVKKESELITVVKK
ncbi:DUF3857 domain-containing protein [Elizabethkingia meningoseptica]|uniref:DUF3857 domain-containing protein n=1 Tax=Elizabethkingia meningoseptica TaxID=238 RepID=UPI003891B7F4